MRSNTIATTPTDQEESVPAELRTTIAEFDKTSKDGVRAISRYLDCRVNTTFFPKFRCRSLLEEAKALSKQANELENKIEQHPATSPAAQLAKAESVHRAACGGGGYLSLLTAVKNYAPHPVGHLFYSSSSLSFDLEYAKCYMQCQEGKDKIDQLRSAQQSSSQKTLKPTKK